MSASDREQFMLKSGKLLCSLAVASSAILLCTAFVSAKEIPIAKEIPGPSVYQKMEEERSRLQDLMRDGGTKSQLPINETTSIPYEKNGRYILPDLRTGGVEFEYPVTVAPGTNGLTPDVSLGFKGNTSIVSANISVLDKIAPCQGNANQYCLGDNHLIPQEGGKRLEVTKYYARSWPSVVISKSENGWTFISKEGLKRSYSKLDNKSEVFQLSRVEDSFGNFIEYQYGKSGGNISLIRYGQRAASEGVLRKIRFHYRGGELREVVSQVGEIDFQKIAISYKNGRAVALQECSFVEQSTSCRPMIGFVWSEESMPILKTVLQGKALKTHISYGNTEGHSVVKSIDYELSGNLLKTDRFEFADALVTNGKSSGFARVWWYQDNKQTGRYIEYGNGLSHGLIIESGVFKSPQDPNTFSKEQPILSSKRKHYRLAQLQHGEFLLLDSVKTTGTGEEGTSTTFYKYDEFGRLVAEVTGSLARNTFYAEKYGMLDSSDIHRIQKIQVVDSQNETAVERQFEYRFEREKLRGIYERITDSKKPNEITISKYIFDDFGNVVEHIGKDGIATKVAYETQYATFPNHMSVEGPEHREEVVLRFDPRFGTQISAHYLDGSFENVVLGPFGLVWARSEKYKDPILKHASDKEYSAIEVIDYSETPSGELKKNFRKLQKAPDQVRSELSKVTRITDAYGRLTLLVAVKHDAQGVAVQKSRIEQNFVGEGRQMRLFQNGQLLQEAHFDQYGQVVYEKSGEYGESYFTYDENGQVVQVDRGQESLSLQYDELGRISEKTLPNGKVYKFQYGEGNKPQPIYVQLPSGKELFFSYSAKGHVTEKVVRLPSVIAGNKSPEFRISYKYKNDQLAEVKYPNGSRVAYIYERGKLSDIRWISASDKTWNKSGASIARFETGRSPDGKFLKKHLANGIVENYKWGQNGKIEGIVYANPSNATANYLDVKYHGNFSSKLTSESISGRFDGSQFSSNLSYKYDDYGHLKTVLYSDDDVSKSPNKIEMDKLEQRLLNAEKDSFGNLILTKKFSGSFAAQHEFDIENKLKSSVVNDRGKTLAIKYDYDHFGKRIEKSVVGGDTNYFIDPFYQIRVSTDEEIEERLFVWDYMGKIASFKRKLKEDQFSGIVAGSTGKTTGVDSGFSVLSGNGLDQVFDNLLTEEIEKEVRFAISSLLLALTLVFLAKSSVSHFVSRAKSVATCLVMISYGTLCVAPTAYAVQSSLLNVSVIPNVMFYHHDIKGSLVARSDDKGVLKHLSRHTPYGALPEAVGEEEYQFAGQEYDAETGLYYAGARYYDPDRGVFLSPDPLRASNNPYEYASSDPVNLIDLSGQAPHEPVASSAPDEDNSEEEPPLEVVVSASSPSAPASAVEMASAADVAPPVATADDGGDEEIIDEPDRWVRYPTFSRITFGYQDDVDIPEYDEVDPAYEDADEDEYNQYVRGEYMQGWTRFGGFVQALGSAFLLALFASTSFEYDDGDVAEAGFGRDLLANFLMLLTFIGFSYSYSGNEADYWAGVQKRKAKAKDYWLVSARRMMWKVSFQLVTFPLLMVARNSIRGYPAFADEDASSTDKLNYLFYNMLRFTPYSLIGNMALLPFFAIFKEPYLGYDDAMTDEKLAAHSWGSRQLIRAALAYRGFAGRKGFWDQDFEEGSWNRRLQNAWYPLNILQLYMWFAVGSCGYYGGLAIMIGKVPGFDQAAFYQAWRRNAILLSLCPPASPLTIVNFWHRKSFTIVKKRSWKNPRTEGVLYRILGPIEGLRLAKFDDTGYLDAHDWMPRLQLIREAVSDEAVDGTEGGHHEHHMNEPSTSEPAP